MGAWDQAEESYFEALELNEDMTEALELLESVVTIDGCTFTNNSGRAGGAIYSFTNFGQPASAWPPVVLRRCPGPAPRPPAETAVPEPSTTRGGRRGTRW